jgi:hypothetical protein
VSSFSQSHLGNPSARRDVFVVVFRSSSGVSHSMVMITAGGEPPTAPLRLQATRM